MSRTTAPALATTEDGLYLNPPDRAAVFSFDEKTPCQALDRTQVALPLTAGLAATMTDDYRRHGTVDLFAACSAGTARCSATAASATRS